MSAPRIVLASASPRRRALLAQIGLDVEVLAVEVDEAQRPGEAASAYVLRLAQAKAAAAARRVGDRAVVIAADTAVVIDDLILGKPVDREDFEAMLTRLSGRSHEVLTGVTVSHVGQARSAVSRTSVRFRPIEPREIAAYWASGEPADKAGGYGIQGVGGIFVERLDGSYSGVVGLPLAETEQMLTELGVNLWKCRDDVAAGEVAGDGEDEGRATTPWAKTSSSTSTTSKPG
jgi:septum formation protein